MRMKTDTWNQILAIGMFADGAITPLGTGFLIGGSLALTATHCVNDTFLKDLGEHYFVVVQIVDRGAEPLLWNVRGIYRIPSLAEGEDRPLDIAVLKLGAHGESNPAIEAFRGNYFELNVATPSVGETVKAYGYAKSRIETDPGGLLCFELRHAYRRVEGRITEIHVPQRDAAFLPFPCFSVEGDFEPGMSGGPVFNERNQVCGLITGGGIDGISWASVLWPALGIKLDGRYLLDYARATRIRASNHHCVTLHESPDGPIPSISFDPRGEVR